MDKKAVLDLVKSPKEFEVNSLAAITEMIHKYPYFQPLYAIKLKLQNYYGSFQYNTCLKTTAAYTQDRSVLFDFITAEKFHQLDVANKIDLLIDSKISIGGFAIITRVIIATFWITWVFTIIFTTL